MNKGDRAHSMAFPIAPPFLGVPQRDFQAFVVFSGRTVLLPHPDALILMGGKGDEAELHNDVLPGVLPLRQKPDDNKDEVCPGAWLRTAKLKGRWQAGDSPL